MLPPAAEDYSSEGHFAVSDVVRAAVREWCGRLLRRGLIAAPLATAWGALVSFWDSKSGMPPWLASELSRSDASDGLCCIIRGACNYVRHLLLAFDLATAMGVLVDPAQPGTRFPVSPTSAHPFWIFPFSEGVTSVVALGPLLSPLPGVAGAAAAATRLAEKVYAVSASFVAPAGAEAEGLPAAAALIRKVISERAPRVADAAFAGNDVVGVDDDSPVLLLRTRRAAGAPAAAPPAPTGVAVTATSAAAGAHGRSVLERLFSAAATPAAQNDTTLPAPTELAAPKRKRERDTPAAAPPLPAAPAGAGAGAGNKAATGLWGSAGPMGRDAATTLLKRAQRHAAEKTDVPDANSRSRIRRWITTAERVDAALHGSSVQVADSLETVPGAMALLADPPVAMRSIRSLSGAGLALRFSESLAGVVVRGRSAVDAAARATLFAAAFAESQGFQLSYGGDRAARPRQQLAEFLAGLPV